MFASAYIIASKYTFPVIQSVRYYDGTVESGMGSCILLNADGWILTASHMVEALRVSQIHQTEILDYDRKRQEIHNNASLSTGRKSAAIAKLQVNKKWITNVSYFWGDQSWIIQDIISYNYADIAISQISNFTPIQGQVYPNFKTATDDLLGASLCKLGFPFIEAKSTWNPVTNGFVIPSEMFPIARFPIEGIGTRLMIHNIDPQITVKKIETSSPGLRGQSGGPIFDVNGNIRAMQSETAMLPLGFFPEIMINNKKTIVPQYLNVGIGVCTETILAFLQSQGVQVSVVP